MITDMPVHDLRLPELLDCEPDQGVVRLHDQRVVVLSAAAMGLLRKEVVQALGAKAARRLLMRFGYADGYQAAACLRDGASQQDPLERFKAGPMLHTLEGIVRATLRTVDYDAEHGRFEAEADWFNSYEGEQHAQLCGRSQTPVCWSLVGYASGYASACLGREVYFREIRCIGQGAAHCVVVGRDADTWGHEADGFREDLAGANLGEEVERVRLAVRHRQQALARRERAVTGRERELDVLRERVARHAAAHRFIVRSRAMQNVLEEAARVAPLEMTVLIGGESGTGKEFLARMIHAQSPRHRGPLVSVNCAALSETLLESELFGHVRGAFTGAVRDKPGLFETAAHGTLFLDEVGDMSPALQAKLLRALQEGEIRRVGGERAIPVTPRVVAASNRDLRTEVRTGSFREDLYFRLGAFVIVMPALRDRREAIPAMAQEFVRRASGRFKKDVRLIAPDAMAHLVAYRWPGNVRQLEHAMERAVILSDDDVIDVRELPPEMLDTPDPITTGTDNLNVHDHERALIQQALVRFPGSRRRAAAALHMSKVTLWRRMKEHGLTGTGGADAGAPVAGGRASAHPCVRE